MNLAKLFEAQKKLDEHIMNEHPELKEQNNLDWKILALQVELGECANEWRGFKKWSKDQTPRTFIKCNMCEGTGIVPVTYNDFDSDMCFWCQGTGIISKHNPLLEEYVDGLHFILSIGLEMGWTPVVCDLYLKAENLISHFIGLYELINNLRGFKTKDCYYQLLATFVGLGEMLGFTWGQIEQAYFEKNKVNHSRQDGGY